MSTAKVLSLGCGWTGSFLLPLLEAHGTRYAFTTSAPAPPIATALSAAPADPHPAARTPPPPPLTSPPPKFNPWPYLPPTAWEHHTVFQLPADPSDPTWAERVHALPRAHVVLIVFPIQSTAVLHKLVYTYEQLHPDLRPSWILLGSAGLWKDGYSTRTSPIDTSSSARGQVEDALLALQSAEVSRNCTVLDLAGLYGHTRNPVNFLRRAARTHEALESKGSLHLIHGYDLARAIAAVVEGSSKPVWGQRWIVTDTRTYDWWLLARTLSKRGTEEEQDRYASWVTQLLAAHSVISLPRPSIAPHTPPPPVGSEERFRILPRVLDSSDFWATVGLTPSAPPVDEDK